MSAKEAKARIKINNLLEQSGWRFFDSPDGRANISLEHRTKKGKFINDKLGNDLEGAPDGFIDYLLLNEQNRPVALVEAKRESIDPLNAKEQAREYARGQNIRHIFLSNGNVHYYWDLEEGNPTAISRFLSLKQLGEAGKWQPAPEKMKTIAVTDDYIALSQDAKWRSYSQEQQQDAKDNKGVRLLRDYQIEAAKVLQKEYVEGKRRFLFEMATGTGKTLLSAAIIKMFIRSGNADRVLFLVDRIELENQAFKNFKAYLGNDAITPVIYKQNRDNWHDAQIVITTIQSFSTDNRYLKLFSPSDFQLIISDEAHRTIGGNNRVIFEYFLGVKLGLTATPKDYLKGVDQGDMQTKDPKQLERRLLLDSYKTFGCDDGIPTYRFSLEDAVKHIPPYLCMPFLLDARTDVTTELLSKQGWSVKFTDDEGNEEEETYFKKDFMRKFFSPETNLSFVRCFLENAKRDPVSGEIGKTIMFCVSRVHCTEITALLNIEAARHFPEQYGTGSDFAVQITSDITGSQDRTISFAENNLNGWSGYNPELVDYESAKTRVCVTVGMMTTGYDCQDLLNVVLARPIFSPSDYIQIKGRGTRLFTFEHRHGNGKKEVAKDNYHLFDFFANHQYFEDEYDYKKRLEPPPIGGDETGGGGGGGTGDFTYTGPDDVKTVAAEKFGPDRIMRVDKEAFSKNFESKAREEAEQSEELREAVEQEDWQRLWNYVNANLFDKPQEFWNFDKLQNAYDIDRRISPEELMRKVFIPGYRLKTRQDLVEEQFERFIGAGKVDGSHYNEAKQLFSAYLMFDDIRGVMNDQKQMGSLATDMRLSMQDLKKLGRAGIDATLNYIKDNVSLNKFLPR
jgi:type I restriction enzyme, R subunit